MSSTAITCNREFSKGKVCGNPIVPVFGTWPEECATCAARILVSTKEGRETFAETLEEHRATLRRLVVAASVPGNVWRVDGLELRDRFQMLDKLEESSIARQRMRAMNIVQRINEGKLNEVRRTDLGYRWDSVTPERASELKKSGFEVRYIGVAWQVKVS